MAEKTRRKSKGRKKIAAAEPKGQSDRGQHRRNGEVLEAAAKVFAERGYSEASVQDVADALGILKGSLYHYIKTKEDLLFWLLEEVHRDVEVILEEAAAAEGLDPLERIQAYVRNQVEYDLGNLERISIYYQDMYQLSADRLKTILDQRHAHERFVDKLIREAQDQGLADASLDARVLTNCLFGIVIWTYRWYRPNGRISRERIATLCADFALHGIVGKPS
ncbi:MAG: TetR/AcrR family transcriptional regulator [Solirubrobacterales bacterium]